MKDLSYHHQSGIFERLFRTPDGRLFRVRFVVVERNGGLRGRIISVEPIEKFRKRFTIYDSRQNATGGQVRFKKRGTYLLPCFLQRSIGDKGLRIKDFYVSPYFNIFELLTPIKIRAPSLRKI